MVKQGFLSLCLLGLLLFGCQDEGPLANLCSSTTDRDTGIIVESLAVSCSFQETTQYVVQDDSTYQAILTACGVQGPVVDFLQHTLLAYATAASGCAQYFEREVISDEAAKRYSFVVRIAECGGCEPWITQTHWVKVPRLPAGYTVDFSFVR